MNDEKNRHCVLCSKPDTELPLIKLSYKSGDYYICPEHMPMLIHKPESLVGKMPGAENMTAG